MYIAFFFSPLFTWFVIIGWGQKGIKFIQKIQLSLEQKFAAMSVLYQKVLTHLVKKKQRTSCSVYEKKKVLLKDLICPFLQKKSKPSKTGNLWVSRILIIL